METESKLCMIEELQSQLNNSTNELQRLRSLHPMDGETSFSSQGGQSKLNYHIKEVKWQVLNVTGNLNNVASHILIESMLSMF